MNYEKCKFHHSHKLLIKGRIMKPVTLENIFEGVYSLCLICALGLCMQARNQKFFRAGEAF